MRATSGTATSGRLAIDAAGHVSAYRPDLLERLGVGVPETWDDIWELDRVARPQGMHVSLPLKAVDTLATWLTLAANAGVEPYADEERILPRDVGTRAPRDPPSARGDVAPRRVRVEPDPAARAHGDRRRRRRLPDPVRLLELQPSRLPRLARAVPAGPVRRSRAARRRDRRRGLGISAHTQQREAALEYATYVASPEIQRTLYVESGGQPGHRSAWLDPAANDLSTGFFRDTLPGLDAGYLRPRYDGALIVQNEGGDITWEHLQTGGDPNALLDRLDDLYRRSLSGVHA